uniref:Uncharacterized protein n=1 Tax=Loa loa TaxID=7209 RepID=A0A1I7VF27_LOALO
MGSAECLVELDRQPTVKQCHEITLKHIEEANDQHSTISLTRFDKMCQALNYFAGCVEQPIAYGCGAEAWTMIFRVLRDTTNTLLPRCQFTGHSSLTEHFPLSQTKILPFTTTIPTSIHVKNDLLQHREMLNNKAEIIWSNQDITTNSISEMNNDDNKKFIQQLPSMYDVDSRRSTLNSQGERSRSEINGHVFIDKDTDISYYDNADDNPNEIASSSSFLAVNSANRIIMLAQYVLLGWFILKIF